VSLRKISIRLKLLLILAGIGTACSYIKKDEKNMITIRDRYKTGRLTVLLDNHSPKHNYKPGLQPIAFADKRRALLYVPGTYTPDHAAALAIMFHGASGRPEHGMSLLKDFADEHNIIIAAPGSRAQTWDIIVTDTFGLDVIFLDDVLAHVFDNFSIDTTKVAIGGFSDGASYALSVGLTNGDLFTHILAFSPGFVYNVERNGKPATFISHGLKDQVLPIDPCSRKIVPLLKKEGLSVTYHEFDGEHEIPSDISREAVSWFME
jgi:phospholipase/carboxylesterase